MVYKKVIEKKHLCEKKWSDITCEGCKKTKKTLYWLFGFYAVAIIGISVYSSLT